MVTINGSYVKMRVTGDCDHDFTRYHSFTDHWDSILVCYKCNTGFKEAETLQLTFKMTKQRPHV